MIYTVRYAHLKELSNLKKNDDIMRGDLIGIMGNTGVGTGAHLHIDCVRGKIERLWKLKDTESFELLSVVRQLNYFIDSELFDCKPIITTPYCDYDYQRVYGKVHHAYDLVPAVKDKIDIFWNRSMPGTVTASGFDTTGGYGNYVLIAFEA